MMKKSRTLLTAGATIAIATVGILIPTLVASGSGTPDGSSYAPIPSAATTAIGVSLAQLSDAQLSQVTVTTAQAIFVADSHQFETVTATNSPTVTIGSFTDSEWAPADAKAGTDLIASNVPAYVVTYSNVSLSSYGPKGGTELGSFSVVVNADTGDYVMAYSY